MGKKEEEESVEPQKNNKSYLTIVIIFLVIGVSIGVIIYFMDKRDTKKTIENLLKYSDVPIRPISRRFL